MITVNKNRTEEWNAAAGTQTSRIALAGHELNYFREAMGVTPDHGIRPVPLYIRSEEMAEVMMLSHFPDVSRNFFIPDFPFLPGGNLEFSEKEEEELLGRGLKVVKDVAFNGILPLSEEDPVRSKNAKRSYKKSVDSNFEFKTFETTVSEYRAIYFQTLSYLVAHWSAQGVQQLYPSSSIIRALFEANLGVATLSVTTATDASTGVIHGAHFNYLKKGNNLVEWLLPCVDRTKSDLGSALLVANIRGCKDVYGSDFDFNMGDAHFPYKARYKPDMVSRTILEPVANFEYWCS